VFPVPSPSFASTEDWWLLVRKWVPKTLRGDFHKVVILDHWKILKERNLRILEGEQHLAEEVFWSIRDEIALWCSAGPVAAAES
jgi:hypothetical protein